MGNGHDVRAAVAMQKETCRLQHLFFLEDTNGSVQVTVFASYRADVEI